MYNLDVFLPNSLRKTSCALQTHLADLIESIKSIISIHNISVLFYLHFFWRNDSLYTLFRYAVLQNTIPTEMHPSSL